MRRSLAFLLLLAASTSGVVTGVPAAAQVNPCKITEQVFGVTRGGDLIVQPFCAKPYVGYLPSRTLAAFGAAVPKLFYGAQLTVDTVALYGVDGDGVLRWYREDPATRRLEPGVAVGQRFGDWRAYRYLQSNGGGDITGVDGDGRLWRWTHTGWRDGADTWAGEPEQTGLACEGARPVFAGRDGPQRYVGVDERSHYVFCGFEANAHTASDLPGGVEAVTMAAGPGASYALAAGSHRLTRMVLDPEAATLVWRLDAVAPLQFSAIFTGRPIVTELPPPLKYEWQWTWYTECV